SQELRSRSHGLHGARLTMGGQHLHGHKRAIRPQGTRRRLRDPGRGDGELRAADHHPGRVRGRCDLARGRPRLDLRRPQPAGLERGMFGTRLAEAMAEPGPLCVGIDPHGHLLRSWGLPCSAAGVREFALRTVAELKRSVAAGRPQSAFFEQHGSAGVAALEETLAAARDAGILSVLDVKRGDIGSTMGAYATAYLDPASALTADSITVS